MERIVGGWPVAAIGTWKSLGLCRWTEPACLEITAALTVDVSVRSQTARKPPTPSTGGIAAIREVLPVPRDVAVQLIAAAGSA